MKHPVLLTGLVCIALLGGCATPGTKKGERHPAREATITPSPAARVLIISATYGSGKKFADVTERVNDLLRQPNAHFWAKPKWLGADPTPGWNKALVIVYELKGRRQVFTAGEGGTVSIARLIKNKEE